MSYEPNPQRYDAMIYNRCGRSGLKLPAISLGLWINFGGVDDYENSRAMIRRAFDLGITHFDLANNYGPPPGSAETIFGQILKTDLANYRDELIISSKAGHLMWDGPYGDWGSRKYLMASLDQSLGRMGLDYVDIFYHHRFDPETPLEETISALADIVRQGKALYVGLSKYPPAEAQVAVAMLKQLGINCLIHQQRYSMLVRHIETGLLDVVKNQGTGCIVFSPLAKGLLTDKYLKGIPNGSRAAKPHGFIQRDELSSELLNKVHELNKIAEWRGQSLAQMAIAWCLRHDQITSVLTGASSVAQIEANIASLQNTHFTDEELEAIDQILAEIQ